MVYTILEYTMVASTKTKPEEVRSLKVQWEQFLLEKKLNTTQQRDVIVDQFLRTSGHLSIDELLSKVRRKNSKIGYATVYRTLKLLAESGIAIERHFGEGQTKYEINGDHHDHLICTRCNTIVEFEDEQIESLQDTIAERYGFVLTRHRHELYGLCKKCKKL